MTTKPTALPESTGVVIGEERGYSDWGHVVDWKWNYHLPKGTTFYTADQMCDYGRAEYLRAIEDCLLLIDNEYLNWSDFRPLENLETVIRALKEQQT